MELFELGRFLHSAVGTIALGSFWTAALATKGGRTHRTAGKVYLLALIGVMTLSADGCRQGAGRRPRHGDCPGLPHLDGRHRLLVDVVLDSIPARPGTAAGAGLPRPGVVADGPPGRSICSRSSALMTLSALMVAGKALEGDPGTAIVLVFLISMVGTASGDVEFHRDARLADWSADDTGRRVWSRPGQTAIWFQLANSSRCAERAPAAPGTRNPRARAVRAPLDVPR